MLLLARMMLRPSAGGMTLHFLQKEDADICLAACRGPLR